MPLDAAPALSSRSRPPQRVSGGLNRVAMITVPERDWDEARMELAEARRDAIALCDALEPRLKRLHGVCALISPTAEQLAAGAVYDVQRYRARQGK
jgi:hypothetical protein